jgi:CheY-like chemotaxis protein
MTPGLRLAAALLALCASACSGLSELQREQAARVAMEARAQHVDCAAPDACARPSPLLELGARANAESAPGAPRHYALLLDYGLSLEAAFHTPRIDASDRGSVRADPGQLEQVLINLTLNARDAMGEGGRLTIETMNVTLDESYATSKSVETLEPGEYAALIVTDTGHGMDRATLSRIFEPFFTTKGVGQGTGLGLSTVYGIVKQSGGFIWAYSELGLGATFKLYFPLVAPVAGPRERRSAAPAGRTDEVVLIAEAEPMVRNIMARALRQCGYTVLEAGNGAEALALLEGEHRPVHLIVADVVMPDMGGRELASRVAQRWPDVPVLFTSGYTGLDVVRRGLLDEGREFLQKPLSPEILAGKVREMVDARLSLQ